MKGISVLQVFSTGLAALLLAACAATTPKQAATPALPENFVYLKDVAPTIQQELRYAGSNNFLGRPVAGYLAPRCILTRPAAEALAAVQKEIEPKGLSLKVLDCYRPQTAVNDFVAWGRDLAEQKTKAAYYPNVPKEALFQRGYIAEKSGHSRGSTVDLTLVSTNATAGGGQQGLTVFSAEVNMGSSYDFFDESSHTLFPGLLRMERHNRLFLVQLMQRYGFKNLPEEWWHFTLDQEPWPQRYFDFPVQ